MTSTFPPLSNARTVARTLVVVLCTAVCSLFSAVVLAQSRPEAAPTAATGNNPANQAIERIRTEDAGSRIDEVRVGGQTQSITVQPKTGTNLPAYEVRPYSNTNGSLPAPSTGGTTGARVWNVFNF